MSFLLHRYIQTRPFLYHLTYRKNIERIKGLKRLDSTKSLLATANQMDLLRTRRPNKVPLVIDDQQVFIRDQAPLYEGNIEFTHGWSLHDLIESLNSRVFFWPGTEFGPIPHGIRHFNRYQSEYPVILRVRFEALYEINRQREPLFCKYNSGSPRYNQGWPSPRGPNTFLPAETCSYKPSQVVEVTFLEYVVLPDDVEYSNHVDGPWKLLFSNV